MTTTTILDLEKPDQGDTNWHIPINANFDSIDEKLGDAYRDMWEIDNVTYISSNAKYVTDHWERWDTTKGAYLIKIDGNANTKTEYYCLSGLGTITWIEIYSIDKDGKIIAGKIQTNSVKCIASDNLRYSDDAYVSSSSIGIGGFYPIKTAVIPNKYSKDRVSSIRVKFHAEYYGDYGGDVYIEVVNAGGYIIISSDGTDYSHDFANVAGGDIVRIYVRKKYRESDIYISNFRIYADDVEITEEFGSSGTITW